MVLKAQTSNGETILARDVQDRSQQFTCSACKQPVIFVDAELRVKHFRHRVESGCDPEPETPAHVYHKQLVYDEIEDLKVGNVYLEYEQGRHRIDVFWQIPHHLDVAFEIQATNYDLPIFDDKIRCYTLKGYLTVYLFVGENFLYEARPNIYSLKEIEKRIFVDRAYKDSVIGAYLDDLSVLTPRFKQKFAKGGGGLCVNRYITDYKHTKQMDLTTFLRQVKAYQIYERYQPICEHKNLVNVKHIGQITRYKVVCGDCGKFIKWLPNREALSLGYEL